MSTLNPNAGEFVPSFAIGENVAPFVPQPCTVIKYPIDFLLMFKEICDTPLKQQLPEYIIDRNCVVPKTSDRIVYTPSYLLKFQPLYFEPPEEIIHTTVFDSFSNDKLYRKKSRRSRKQYPSYGKLNYGDENHNKTNGNSYIIPTDNPEEEEAQAILALNSALDKISTENTETIIELVENIAVTCSSTLYAVIGVIFDRAIADADSCQSYVQLCTHMSEKLPEFKDGPRTINLRRILLTKCYEALVEDPQRLDGSVGNSWRRQCMLKNVGFIGELFRRNLLTENIMHVCIAMMLDQDNDMVVEVIAAVCQLLRLIGDFLDGSSPASRRTMDEYFGALQQLSSNEELPAGIRTLLCETIALRSSSWLTSKRSPTHRNLPPLELFSSSVSSSGNTDGENTQRNEESLE